MRKRADAKLGKCLRRSTYLRTPPRPQSGRRVISILNTSSAFSFKYLTSENLISICPVFTYIPPPSICQILRDQSRAALYFPGNFHPHCDEPGGTANGGYFQRRNFAVYYQSCFVYCYLWHEHMPSLRQPLVRPLQVFLDTFLFDVLGESIRQVARSLYFLEFYFS